MSTQEMLMPVLLEEVVGDRFGRYSKYIIQDRAIPDVRDGLKPVQRRILYAMYEAGNTADRPYRKSAKTVGDVMGNYHPHGDSSIYDGMVRMAQPWKLNHVLIDGHGNWGSLDDDPPAAMRYTEARLSAIAHEMLRDIEKRTVPFKDNFDNTAKEPVVLPARFPNLLVNGVSGISSGFATEIPPHNLREVIDACIAMMDRPDISVEDVMKIIKGPDFPTGGIIMGEEGIRQAYETGRGRIIVRARAEIEKARGGKQQIVISEIPFQVVKSRLVTAMENIRLEKKAEGIAEVRDESGRDGLRIVVELKKDADAEGVLAYLFKKTDLQITYNFNMVAIVNRTPKQLGIRELLAAYIAHQREVVRNRTQFDLEKAEDRAHILEGLIKALHALDEVIALIKASQNRQDAQQKLMATYAFSERQADAILALQLYRLTNLETASLEKELEEVQRKIADLRSILDSPVKLDAVIKRELVQVSRQFGTDRRTDVQPQVEELKVNLEVMVTPEDVYVAISGDSYIKRTSRLSFTRSGGEPESTGLKEGDYLRYLLAVNTLDNLLVFTRTGHYFVLPVHQIPEYKWKENGTALVNLIPISGEDRIVSVIPVRDFQDPAKSLMFVTRLGQIKRTLLSEYETKRTTAVTACKLNEGDEVIRVDLCGESESEVLIISKKGMSIRFKTDEVSVMGRAATGVRAIRLNDGDEVADALWLDKEEDSSGRDVLVISDAGFAKRSLLSDYPLQARGGKGQATFEFREGRRARPNGTQLIRAFLAGEEDEFMAISGTGAMLPFTAGQAPVGARKVPGKAVISLEKGEYLLDVIQPRL